MRLLRDYVLDIIQVNFMIVHFRNAMQDTSAIKMLLVNLNVENVNAMDTRKNVMASLEFVLVAEVTQEGTIVNIANLVTMVTQQTVVVRDVDARCLLRPISAVYFTFSAFFLHDYYVFLLCA